MAIAFAAVVVFSSIAATLSAFAYLPAVAVVETLSPRRASARAATWLCALGIPVAGGIAAAVTGLRDRPRDEHRVPGQGADGGVDLGERDAQEAGGGHGDKSPRRRGRGPLSRLPRGPARRPRTS